MEPWLMVLLVVVVIVVAAAAGFWLVDRTVPPPSDGNGLGRLIVGGLAIISILYVIARAAKVF